MSRMTERDPQMIMTDAARGLRAVGLVFLLLGVVVILFGSWRPFFFSREVQMLVASAALMLVGPGTWYLIAALTMGKNQFTLIRPCIWIGVIQSLMAIGVIVVGIVTRGRMLVPMLIPSVLTIFFVPAVFACVAAMRRAERLTHLFIPEGKAFHVLNLKPLQPPPLPPGHQQQR
jgi:hypothetical protein